MEKRMETTIYLSNVEITTSRVFTQPKHLASKKWVLSKRSPAASPKHVPKTLNPKPSTLNPQPSTLNPKPSTLNPKPCCDSMPNSSSSKLTLPGTNMETRKGPYEDYSPSKRVLYGFPC